MRVVIVVPTYNERENLPAFLEKVRQYAGGADVLIVDDNSPDGTGQLADALAAESGGRISVLHRRAKEGLGRAYVAGFGRALEMGYDILLQMDADLSHDPASIPDFLERIQDCGLVVGSRYVGGIRVVNWDFKRLLLSKAATLYVRAVTGMRLTDSTGGFKCWKAETLKSIGLERVFSNGYLFQIEMNYRVFRGGFRTAEVPIIFYERNLGRSKMDWRIILEALLGVIRLRLSR
ncbi:MAG: polyprenol monophosphomannose synthase [Bryobacterales bacterium]|nr:polyprenol monophosphomannose synthase [Bryobacterales bacterium]